MLMVPPPPPQVLNKRALSGRTGVYIGRPSKWGNPFVIGADGDRSRVVALYEGWLMSKPSLRDDAVRELRGKNLVCFCAPAACHGDVLLRVANAGGATC